jgi:hypothetical protein
MSQQSSWGETTRLCWHWQVCFWGNPFTDVQAGRGHAPVRHEAHVHLLGLVSAAQVRCVDLHEVRGGVRDEALALELGVHELLLSF